MMRAVSAFLFLGLTAAACSSAGGDTESDGVPPTLEITSPERGTFSEQESVVVTGRVTGDKVKVTVNGQSIVPGSDGAFSAAVTVGKGLGFLETHAIDADGDDVRDVRAVLAGPVSATDGSIAAPMAAKADAAALMKVGAAIGNTAEGIDFNAAVAAMNPVFHDDGCLGAKVDVTDVELADIGVALVPQAGALQTAVVIRDVVVTSNVRYKVACIGGSSTVTVRATAAKINGALGVKIQGGAVKTALPNATVVLEGFSVDASGIPGVIEDLVEGRIRDAIANAITDVIQNQVPGLADDALAGLVGQPLNANLLGRSTQISLEPTTLELSAGGLYFAVDTKVSVAGGEGGMFVSTPIDFSPALVPQGAGLNLALADDLANQLFSGMWASGALDLSLPITAVGPAAAFLDYTISTLDVKFSLPPMITTAGSELAFGLGDVIITGRDDAGNAVQTLALSASSTVVAAPDASGAMALELGTPTIKAQVLTQLDSVQSPLTGESLEGIITGAWSLITPMANDALRSLPLPSIAGLSFGTPSLAGHNGFVLAAIPLL